MISPAQQAHTLAGRSMPPTSKASQRVCLPNLEKEIFKNAHARLKRRTKNLTWITNKELLTG